MKNNILFLIKSKLNLNIKGPNIERFIKRLKNNNVEMIKINYINKEEINIVIYKKDFDKVTKLKTIYEIEIINYYGIVKTKNTILYNKYIIVFLLIGLIFIYIITSMIFEVDVITSDSKMEEQLKQELGEFGIKKYKFKKNYIELQNIKDKLLSNHKEELEWLEIDNIGTKYIIKYEPRIKNKEKVKDGFRNIVAKKDCIIKELNIHNGQIIKDVNSYVKKGEVIVSGYIDSNGIIKDTVSSSGTVYGEVWYQVELTYPYRYKEIKETGNTNNAYVISFINKDIELFNFNQYKTKKITENTILKNNLLPIKLVKQSQKETIVIDEENTEDEVIEKAIKLSKNKIEKKLHKKEYISDTKVLYKIKNKESITLSIFFSVVEDVTEYFEIDEYKEEKTLETKF